MKKKENKILVSNMKAKMFRGYHQVMKKLKKEKRLESLTDLDLNLEDLIFMLKSKRKSKKEYLPFEYDYDYFYRNKYTNRLDDMQNDDLQIINLTNQNRFNKDISNLKKDNMFLTQTKTKNGTINSNNEVLESKNKKYIFQKLFPDKQEIYKYSELPFFSLTKNPHNFGINSNNIINLRENDDTFSKDDFLYKLSHKRENEGKYIKNNFNKNKGVKKGIALTTFYNTNNNNNKKKKKELILDVKNISKNKQIYLNSKEKRYKILEKEIEPLKNIISLFKDFEKEIEKEEIKSDYNNNNDIDKLKIEPEIDLNSQQKEENNIIISGNNFDQIASRTTYNSNPFKKPKFYPINYYSSKQVMQKEKRYENIHKLGIEEFQRKINLKSRDNSLEKLYKKKYVMDEYEKELFKKLIKREKLSLKDGYLRNCRINDIILVSKLKCEFSPKDVKRVLNGIKPWDDCQKLDKKYFDKNLPSKVQGIKKIEFK